MLLLLPHLSCSLSTPKSGQYAISFLLVVGVQEPVMKNQSARGAEEDSLGGTGAMRGLAAL